MVARCQPQQLQSPVQSQYYDVKDKNSDGPQNYAEGEEDREDEEYDEGVGDTYDTYGYDYQRRRPSTPHQLGTETTPNRMNSCRVFDQVILLMQSLWWWWWWWLRAAAADDDEGDGDDDGGGDDDGDVNGGKSDSYKLANPRSNL